MIVNDYLNNLINAFIDDSKETNGIFSPEFIYNSNKVNDKRKVFTSILNNLEECDEFIFSVAFINESGLSLFKEIFKTLEKKGIKGKILTTNYLNFTEPKALKELSLYKNIEIKMSYLNEQNNTGFHTKGYIFRYKDNYKVIIGSSNMTQSALTTNNEWNNEIIGSKDGKVIKNILEEFYYLWEKSKPLNGIISQYEYDYNNALLIKKSLDSKTNIYKVLKPNAMQVMFINNLNETIKQGKTKGLLISSTGTGKTYASAFAIRDLTEFKVKKLLFVTHRETILKQAEKTYKDVFSKENIKTSILSSNNHNVSDSDFIFATLNTLRKDNILTSFKQNYFDFIIIDEVHRVGDNTYQKIIDYFKPKFLLGMSATPDRTDGYDIYKLFDYNIIYEIRLEQALEAQMVCPFHYFGVSDIKLINDEKTISFDLLTCDERVNKIIEYSKYYSYCGNRLKCLCFVSRIEEGKTLSLKLNQKGLKTVFLDGSISINEREKYIDQLEENDINKDYLDMILTVDIFNEGVDIPSINQVIFLRPTQSSIIFLQQLGRGLRKYNEKDYVTIIDFIANYKNNYIIPLSFEQKGSGGTNGLVKVIEANTLPGASIIQFDEVAKKQIFNSIKENRIYQAKNVKEQYDIAKNRAGKVPTIIDFDKAGKLSSRVFLDFQTFNSYYDFLAKYEDNIDPLNEDMIDTIRYLSKNIGNGQRIHEPLLLKYLIEGKTYDDFKKELIKNNFSYDEDVEKSIISVLNTSFDKKATSKTKEVSCITIKENKITLSNEFFFLLLDKTFKEQVLLILHYAIYSFNNYFKENYDNKIVLKIGEKYSRKDVCRLINYTKNIDSTMYGYKSFNDLNVVPLFITYNKNLKDNDSINYEDRFLTPNLFEWISKNKRTKESKDIQDIVKINNSNGKILLFIKKENISNSKNDENSFYFLGDLSIYNNDLDNNVKNIIMKSGENAVKFIFKLKNEVPYDLYKYLTMDIKD